MALTRAQRAVRDPFAASPVRCGARPRRWRLLASQAAVVGLGLWATLGQAVPPAHAATGRAFDATRSEIGFILRTRWGQQLDGRFPEWSGEILALPDGAQQVRLTLATGGVEIVGNRSYTRITRGPGFFDVERHPEAVFVSDPYPAGLLRDGGAMTGVLSIRGVRQRESFRIEPASCERPAIDCDVVGQGDIRRSRYAMDRWGYALSDQVRFMLRIRVAERPE